jgi:hypothetical protein
VNDPSGNPRISGDPDSIANVVVPDQAIPASAAHAPALDPPDEADDEYEPV